MLKGLILISILIIAPSCTSPAPQKFEANIPRETVPEAMSENSPIRDAAVIIVESNGDISFKGEKIGKIDETAKLESELKGIFDTKKKSNDPNATAVFIKAKKNLKYADLTKLIDKLKAIGAGPIGLELEG